MLTLTGKSSPGRGSDSAKQQPLEHLGAVKVRKDGTKVNQTLITLKKIGLV